jgi:hypothetical protein
MPRVHAENGFTIHIYPPPREHGPPHVHVLLAGTEVVINLSVSGESISVRSIEGMLDKDVVRAARMVESCNEQLLAKWREYHDA